MQHAARVVRAAVRRERKITVAGRAALIAKIEDARRAGGIRRSKPGLDRGINAADHVGRELDILNRVLAAGDAYVREGQLSIYNQRAVDERTVRVTNPIVRGTVVECVEVSEAKQRSILESLKR